MGENPLRTVVIYKTFETRIKHAMPTNINFVNHFKGPAVNNGSPSPYPKAHMNDQLHLHKNHNITDGFSLSSSTIYFHSTMQQ